MIEVSIAHDEHFNALGEFEQLLFLRILPHTDDVGRFSAHPDVIKARTFPFSNRKIEDFTNAVISMVEVGLIELYRADEKAVMQFKGDSFRRINAVLVKNSDGRSEYPSPVTDSFLTVSEYVEFITTWQARGKHVLARAIVSKEQQVVSKKQKVESKKGEGLTKKAEGQSFDDFWSRYPNRQGRKIAERHFGASVKTPEDVACFEKALRNYLASGNVRNGYVKNGSTWFNQWRDWIDPTEIMMKGNASGSNQTQPGSQAARATYRPSEQSRADNRSVADSIRRMREDGGERS